MPEQHPAPRQNPDLRRESIQYWLETAKWSVLILLALELVIRLFIFKTPFYVFDPAWGVIPRANTSFVQGVEGFGVTHYLANGEVETPYKDGVSVVVLGDSYTLGAQVDDSEKYVSLTERALRERGVQADLRNLGSPARSVADYVYMAPAIMQAYVPQVVVVQANSVNFLMSFDCNRENCFQEQTQNGLALVHRDGLTGSTSVAFQNVIGASGLLSYVAYRVKNVYSNLDNEHIKALEEAQQAGERAGTDPDAAGSGLNQEEQVLLQVYALQEAYPSAKIVFIVIPDLPKLPIDRTSSVTWISPNDELIVNLLQGVDGVYVVFPRKAFRQLYEQDRHLPRGFSNSIPNFGHMNQYGHLAVAHALTDVLQEIFK